MSSTISRRRAGSSSRRDRKSTRLNSSHSQISYAVFCLKKKKHTVSTTAASSQTIWLIPSSVLFTYPHMVSLLRFDMQHLVEHHPSQLSCGHPEQDRLSS